MYRIGTGFLIVLLAAGPLQGQDKPNDQPSTPAGQYQALEAEFQAAQRAYEKAVREAQEKKPNPEKFATRFLELAEKNPKDEAAVDALLWVVRWMPASRGAKDSPRSRALNALLRDHIGSGKLGTLCEQLASATDKTAETFLRAVLEKNTHREVQGQACLSLAQYLKRRATIVRRLKEQPEAAKQYETMLGKEYMQELLAQDPKKVDQEVEQLYDRIVKEYADLKRSGRGSLGAIAQRELFEIRNLAVGKTAPEIEGEDLDGKRFKLSDYRGKVVLLDFWGHWAGPSRALLPYERSLVKRLDGKPFALIGVNSDKNREETKRRNEKDQIRWRSFWNGGSKQGPISSTWNIKGWPTLYILDARGVIRHRYMGSPGEEVLDENIDALVKEAEGTAEKKAPE